MVLSVMTSNAARYGRDVYKKRAAMAPAPMRPLAALRPAAPPVYGTGPEVLDGTALTMCQYWRASVVLK